MKAGSTTKLICKQPNHRCFQNDITTTLTSIEQAPHSTDHVTRSVTASGLGGFTTHISLIEANAVSIDYYFCRENGADANYSMVVVWGGAIVIAAEAGETEAVRLLLERGEDVNEVGVGHPTDPRVIEEMGTALHKSVTEGHVGTVKLLLEHSSDVNLQDIQRRTPLALATRPEIAVLHRDSGTKQGRGRADIPEQDAN
ncbi:hypothetical protein P153DRAFT_391708 [Dothidotthia symphoricarpi CBS 119687]|uniref:Uncharacterized protein n=1 Tax=Dothidotthia symphoricarpi CBS 119687 TaxID=1392245 RepID=A0A6A6AQU7_9PLEO|nr:uncharacterized protein P153DRAFT_391708 [Dothidotthia symphoricarpi CBS 119687]KAF2134362.1 hypothetical protein P153DRAFT_391708 [Dothidotthia symphoricarpi CBS 119687]